MPRTVAFIHSQNNKKAPDGNQAHNKNISKGIITRGIKK